MGATRIERRHRPTKRPMYRSETYEASTPGGDVNIIEVYTRIPKLDKKSFPSFNGCPTNLVDNTFRPIP